MLLNKKELPKDQGVVVCLICLRQIRSTFTLRASNGDLRRPHPHQDEGCLPFLFTELENLLVDTKKIQCVFRRMKCWALKRAYESSKGHFWACLSISFKVMEERNYTLGFALFGVGAESTQRSTELEWIVWAAVLLSEHICFRIPTACDCFQGMKALVPWLPTDSVFALSQLQTGQNKTRWKYSLSSVCGGLKETGLRTGCLLYTSDAADEVCRV